MSLENFDVYNENMEYIGTEIRSEVHKKGYWHKTFQCWFISKEQDKSYILFQKRHINKDTYPNLLDITSAGHLMAGEQIRDGVREIEEELGLKVSFDDLIPVAIIKDRKIEENFVDAEFANVFLYKCKTPMEQFKLQSDEVVGIFKADLNEIIKLHKYMVKYVQIEGYEIDSLGEKQHIKLRVELKDFVPHKPPYYMQVFKAAEKVL